MTGPEHYREAETDLDAAARASDRGQDEDAVFWLRSAQVHATLALTAATAMAADLMPVFDADAWQSTAGTQPEPGTVEP